MGSHMDHVPEHIIIVIPGILGSRLRVAEGGPLVWLDLSSIPSSPLRWSHWLDYTFNSLSYPQSHLEADGILDELLVIQPWVWQQSYGRLLSGLAAMGYHINPNRYRTAERDVYSFAYDWRQDNRISARQLAQLIEQLHQIHPHAQLWLICHSMGGLVARWYIEHEGGKERVSRLFLLSSPSNGAPMTFEALIHGFSTFLHRGFDPLGIAERIRAVVRTFPSIYQLLPFTGNFLHDATGAEVDLELDTSWIVDPDQFQLFHDGLRFSRELGTVLSVETLCFFGTHQPTLAEGLVHRSAYGRWSGVTWERFESGDGTIPERSAAHMAAREQLPFAVGHGDIIGSPAVLEKLSWELIRKFQLGVPSEAINVALRAAPQDLFSQTYTGTKSSDT